MSLPQYILVNHPHIIHEIIDGEAILVNLENGSYYSTDQVGAAVWDQIERGAPVAAIRAQVLSAYNGDPSEIGTAVDALLQQLLDERLVIPSETAAPDPVSTPAAPVEKSAFVTPVLRKYTEMEDLLLLDPIHDVDESGWPQRPPENSAQ